MAHKYIKTVHNNTSKQLYHLGRQLLSLWNGPNTINLDELFEDEDVSSDISITLYHPKSDTDTSINIFKAHGDTCHDEHLTAAVLRISRDDQQIWSMHNSACSLPTSPEYPKLCHKLFGGYCFYRKSNSSYGIILRDGDSTSHGLM